MENLSDMSLEELWKLFPIILTEHRDSWVDWYNEEISVLKLLLPKAKFHHIGSTAIKDIWAKPIIDILLVVNTDNQFEQAVNILQRNGYLVMSSSNNRVSLNKGYTQNGFAEKVFHMHIRKENDVDEIYFRDYLNLHSDIAKEYERLKLCLWKKFEYNRNAYTSAKTEFINKYTNLAKKT